MNGLNNILDPLVRRQDYHRKIWPALFEMIQKFEAVHLWHPNIRDHEVEGIGLQRDQGFNTVPRGSNLKFLLLQKKA